ncbi:MAG: hypothetical protein DRQ49_00815 [Gammaproteobacteria bacterium]|nr:MAG: hypothetical protein DRQ49_00815 [Gammaproteobacteria bacterium]RKZ77331.1 MAG: hypothetical protein DRQ57_00475 [Gammaproteobacteria bacterium]
MSNVEPIRVLYIEDDIITATRVQIQLSQHGYVIDLAMDGKEGLAKLKKNTYDIAVIDYNLPSMNGLQVLQHLVEGPYEIPGIMVTGEGNERVAVNAMKIGAGDYLIKDLNNNYFELLPEVIECELEKQRLIKDRLRTKNALHERNRILEAVNFAAEEFLTGTHWTQPIQDVLARLGQAVAVSRVYIFENHSHEKNPLLTSQRYEWVANGITSQIDNPERQNFPYHPHLKRVAEKLAENQPFYGLVKDFPPGETEIFEAQNILSIAIVPVFVGKEWWGFIGYDDCVEEREWPAIVIDAFKTASNILGAAIQHDQMDQALRESEARLAETQRIAHLGHCEWDMTSNTRFLSEETCQILGLSSEQHQVSNEFFINVIHPEDRQIIQKAVEQTIDSNAPYDIEFRIIRPDEKVRYIHALSKLFRDTTGKPKSFLGTIQDITEYKQVEKALRDSTEMLGAILNAATDSIVMTELDTTCVIINPAAAARLGHPVDELVGLRLCELVAPEIATRRKGFVNQVICTKQPTLFEDDESQGIWFEHSVYPMLDEADSVYRIAIVSRNISQRKLAEENLRKERDFIDAIINSAGSLVVVLDRLGHIVRFNKTCEKLTGYTFEEVKNHFVWDFFLIPEELEPVKNYFQNLVLNHPPLRHENYWLTKDKQRRLIDWSNTILLDDNQVIEYVIGTGIDITERKKAEEALARTLVDLKVILDNSPVGIAFLAEGQRLLRFNHKLEEIFGYTEKELQNSTTEMLYFSSEDYEKIGQKLYPLLKQGATYKTEQIMRRKDGSPFWCRLLVKAINPNELSKGFIWNCEDVTEQKRTEENLRLAATVFETITEGIIVTGANYQIIMVNPAFTTITGYHFEEVVGKKPHLLKSENQDAKFYETMWTSLNQIGKWQGELWNQRKNGKIYAESKSIVAIRDSNHQIVQYVTVFSDITQRKQAEKLIWHQANYDSLTELPNRTLFADRLAQAMITVKRQPGQLAVMFIDLDRFKWVNDNLGHKAGDLLLKEVAQRLTVCIRESDTVARFGGDEFTIILSKIEEVLDIKVIAMRILETLSQPFMLEEKQEVSIGGSIGIAVYPEDGQEAETLLRKADIAMYQAKERGRNTFCFFEQFEGT